MKKTVSLLLLASLFVCSSNVLADAANCKSNRAEKSEESEKGLTAPAMVAGSILSTVVTLGTFAGMSYAFSKIGKIDSDGKKIACKFAACFSGAIISAANFSFLATHIKKLLKSESSYVRNFCCGLMVPNIIGSAFNLAHWVVFLGR